MAEDKHAGLGGSYMINDAGEKVLVHRTDYVAPEPPAPAKKQNRAAPVADNKPQGE